MPKMRVLHEYLAKMAEWAGYPTCRAQGRSKAPCKPDSVTLISLMNLDLNLNLNLQPGLAAQLAGLAPRRCP